MDDVKGAADRSRKLRELRGVVASQLTEVLAEVQQVRPRHEAPPQVDRFVAAAERTLAELQERARAEGGRERSVAPPAAPESGGRAGQAETEHRYGRS